MSSNSRITEAKSVQIEPGLRRRFFSYKTTQIIVLIFSTIEILIAIRFMLKLIGARPESPIVALIYGFTDLFLIPFVGAMNSLTFGRMVLEIYSLFAIFIYSMTGIALEKLAWVLFLRSNDPVEDVTETTTNKQDTAP